MDKNSRNRLLLPLVVVVLVIAGIWLGLSIKDRFSDESDYTAVYLRTGDMYFGEFSRFPRPQLTNAWHLDRTVDAENQPQVGLTPMSSVFWSPAGTIYLNPDEISFWAPLKKDSDFAKALAGTGNPPAANPAPQQQQQQVPASTDTDVSPDTSGGTSE